MMAEIGSILFWFQSYGTSLLLHKKLLTIFGQFNAAEAWIKLVKNNFIKAFDGLENKSPNLKKKIQMAAEFMSLVVPASTLREYRDFGEQWSFLWGLWRQLTACP